MLIMKKINPKSIIEKIKTKNVFVVKNVFL